MSELDSDGWRALFGALCVMHRHPPRRDRPHEAIDQAFELLQGNNSSASRLDKVRTDLAKVERGRIT